MNGLNMLNRKSLLAMAAAFFLLGQPAAYAENVTLQSLDGTTSLSGKLIGFDGNIFQLETNFGTLELSVSQVTCSGAECPDLVSDLSAFTITGSNRIGLQIMPAMIEAYAFEQGGDLEVEAISPVQVKYTVLDANGDMYSEITLNLGTSNDAFAALESREAAIGLSSRRVTAEEQGRLWSAGRGDLTSPEQERILALDGIAVTVSLDNPIRTLSLDQISDIFAGNIRNWREVGGLDAAITVYRRDQDSGATQVFETLVMAPADRVLVNTAFILGSNAAVSDAVAQDRNGIGITSSSEERNAKVLSLRSVCGQISRTSAFSIKTEEYPISHRLFLYTASGAIPDKAMELIDFLGSETAQGVVEQVGLVSQNVVTASLNNQGRRLAHALTSERDPDSLARLQDMVAGLLDAERLSLTFRFRSGSISPDNRALVDINRLIEMVRSGAFDGKNLMVLGFSDNSGEVDEDQRLSQARADFIRDVLAEAAGADAGNVQLTALGYGALSPLGCNETEDGRDTNRRVEIWVR